MPLSESDKVQVRRHLRYPIVGLPRAAPVYSTLGGALNSYRFFQSYGMLEYRLNQLSPQEEAVLLGKYYGALGFQNAGTPISVGQTITTTITSAAFSGGALSKAYTIQATDTILSITVEIGNLFIADPQFNAANFYVIAPFGTGPWANQLVPFPLVAFLAPFTTPFTLSVSGGGNTQPQVVMPGQLLPPFITLDNTYPSTLVYGFLPIVSQLENDFGSATTNLSVTKAREATLRPSELSERIWLYDTWCGKMAEFLGISWDIHNKGANSGPRSRRPNGMRM